MLVLEPMKRYTIEQIKKHRWMSTEPYTAPVAAPDPVRSPAHTSTHNEPNEQVLRLMQSLGIDPIKTKEVSNLTYIILNITECFCTQTDIVTFCIELLQAKASLARMNLFELYIHLISDISYPNALVKIKADCSNANAISRLGV